MVVWKFCLHPKTRLLLICHDSLKIRPPPLDKTFVILSWLFQNSASILRQGVPYYVMIVWKFHLNPKTRRLLKRVCHEIFDHQFFHDLNPFGSMINKLKYFRIWFRFCRDIQSQNSKNFTPQCAWQSKNVWSKKYLV